MRLASPSPSRFLASLTMTATANSSTASRNAIVTVTGGGLKGEITVSQAGATVVTGPSHPLLDGLAGEYTQDSPPVTLKLIGNI